MAAKMISLPVILGGGLLCAAAIGGTAFVTLNSAKPPAEKQVKLIEMIGAKYPMGQTAVAVDSPTIGALTVTRLRQGTEVEVVGIVEGDGWYQIELPDKHLAYVEVAAIPAAAAQAAPSPPAPAPAAPAPAPAAPPAAAPTASPTPTPQAAAVPATATPAPAAAAPQTATYAGPPTIDVPPVMQFDDAHDVARVINPTAVYLKPDRQAPQAYPVGIGTRVYVVARSKDGNWAWVNTADGAPAYMPVSDIAE